MWFQWCVYCCEGTITVVRPNNAKRNKATAFKNAAPFINCISKINNAENQKI